MLSQLSNFKYIDRGSQHTIALIPGWASDQRIFQVLNLNFNYLIPLVSSFSDFAPKLLASLKGKGLQKISLLGWSLGAFLAASFSVKFPQFIDELILIGVRRKYSLLELSQVRTFLQRDKKAYLYKFYCRCFFCKEKMAWFKENLMQSYFTDFGLESLLSGLDYLEKAALDLEGLRKVGKVKIIHGQNDEIAPLEEAEAVKQNLPEAEITLVKNCGHAVFLEDDIGKYI